MLRDKLLLITLAICFLSVTSADSKKQKPLFYFNSLKDLQGINISHAPGIYSSAITVKIDEGNYDNLKVQLITDNRARTVSGSVKIDAPSVLRISYKDNDGVNRNFVGNYIVNVGHKIPVVALVVDTNDFFPPNGIYEGHMEPNPNGGEPLTIGRAWNKQPITAYAQFFFNDKLQEELELDVKTYGGMTLGWKEKSLQLSARKKLHGEAKINVKLFENLPQREFQHVVLRTSGNDQNKTRIKDMSISHVADEIGVNTKASRQVVLYVNGKYWGIHNLREKVNEDYFTERFNWKKDEFIEIQGSGFRDPVYKSLIDYAREHSGDNDFHQRISDSIDVESFYNFNIIQTFISNPDYRGNVRFFKKKGDKWKWLLYDTDLGCGSDFINRNFIRDRTFPIHEYWYNPDYAVTLLNNMLKNEDFKKSFIKQYTYLMSTYLTTENFHAKLDKNAANIKDELDRHWKRRDNLYKENENTWNGHVKSLKTYFAKRPESAYKHLMETFSLEEPVKMTVTQNMSHFKGLSMNGSAVKSMRIEGKFFKELPIDLEAVLSDHLYEFVKWSDGEKKLKRTISPTDGKSLKAEFKHLTPSKSKDRLLIDKYYVQNDWNDPLLFVAISNATGEEVKMDNYTIYEDVTGSLLSLKGKVIPAGKSIVLTNDCELFKKKVKNKELDVIKFMAGKTFVDEFKFVLVENGKGWVDSLQGLITDEMLINDGSFLITKNEGKVEIKNFKMKDLGTLKFETKVKFDSLDSEEAPGWMKITLLSLFGLGVIVMLLFMIRKRKKNMRNDVGMILLMLCFSSIAFSQAPVDSMEEKSDRFGLSSIEKRVIDNKGLGDDRFDGTRNFRVVLYDMVYRGGGNNLHLKDTIPKYYLWNPMPLYGLRQLHEVGFDKAYYLYSHNFEYWYPQYRLDSLNNEGFEYVCEPKVDEDLLLKYYDDIMARANDSVPGMMYIHCWNGWHQSGLLSAYTLMQFCDYSNYQARKYWERCTDGNYKGFNAVKTKIREYKPIEGYSFTEEQKKRFCPCSEISDPDEVQSEDDKINLSTDEMMEPGANGGNTSSSKDYTYHTIRKGESLGLIAEKYGMGLTELQRLNGIRGTTIYAGDRIKVIDRKGVNKTSSSSTSSSSSSSSTGSSAKTHKVRSGDSLYSIALKYNTTVEKIMKVNGLKNDLIHPGDVLKLP